jgi:hypothetical protein
VPNLPRLPMPGGDRGRPAGTRRAVRPLRLQAAPRRFTVGPAERKRPRREIPWRRIGLGVSSLVIAGGVVYGMAWLLLGDTLRVRDIYINGTEVADPQQVASAAGLAGQPLLPL